MNLKMKFKVDPSRCCFCIPLRYGIIIWACLKLILTTLMCIYSIPLMYMLLIVGMILQIGIFNSVSLVMTIIVLYVWVDLLMIIVFLVGALQKSAQKFKIFYIHSIIYLIAYIGLYFWFEYLATFSKDNYSPDADSNDSSVKLHDVNPDFYTETALFVLFVCIQVYMIVLLKIKTNKMYNADLQHTETEKNGKDKYLEKVEKGSLTKLIEQNEYEPIEKIKNKDDQFSTV